MAKVTAVIGSPRKKGNCAAIVDKMVEKLKAKGDEVEVFYINDIDAKGCQACMGCKKGGKGCIRKDGMTPVLASVQNCDALIVATPTYFGHATAQYRLFEDRMYGFVLPGFTTILSPGKKVATVVTCGGGLDGAKVMADQVNGVMANFFKFEPIGTIVYSEAQGGPAAENADVMAQAEEIASKI